MNIHHISKSFLFGAIAVWLIAVSSHVALADGKTKIARAEMDQEGLRLAITYDDANMTVICVLQNTTAKPFMYLSQGITSGFVIRLYDSIKKEIKLTGRWANFDGNAEMLSNVRQILEPGGVLKLTIPLQEALGDKWKPGMSLEIGWNPGDEGFINPHFVGKTLRASIVVGGETTGNGSQPAVPDSSLNPQSIPALKEALIKKSVAESVVPAASTPWSVIGILTLAAIGLLWLRLKRRS